MAAITKKVAASTIVEVLVALVIIMIVFAIAMRVFGNVMQSGVSLKKVQVREQLKMLRDEVIKAGSVSQNKMQIDSVEYNLSTTQYDGNELETLEITATQQGRNVGSLSCIFKTTVDE